MPTLVLPRFSLSKRDPHPPNRHRKVASCELRAPGKLTMTVTLKANWPRNKWFVTTSADGWKMAQTLATGNAAKAAAWEAAIRKCDVVLSDDE